MRRSTSTSGAATPPAPTSPKPGATMRQRKAVPLGDVTNIPLLRPETPAPIKPRRTARRPIPAPSDASAASSTCSSSAASVTPALNPSSSVSTTPAPEPSSSAAPVTAALQPLSSATATPAPRPPSTVSATPAPRPSSAASSTPAPPEPSSAATATPAPPEPSSAAMATPAPPEPSSAATATPAPKRSFAAELDEEESVFESPTICTVYARRRTTEVQVEVERRSNLTVTNKGKEPVGAAASCPPLGKSTRNIRKKNTRTISSSAPCHEAQKKRPHATTPKLPEEFVKKQKAYFADVDAFELAEEEVSESELE